MSALELFSADYHEARQKFVEIAKVAGADLDSYCNDHDVTSKDQLFTDVAAYGPADAENVLVLMSGVHGVEGFAGSAIQTGLFRENIVAKLPQNTRLVMIHAINPYGFAHLRRFNEDNVDLNRNFINHDEAYPENKGYEKLADVIAPKSHSSLAPFASTLNILWLRLLHGSGSLQEAVSRGQYSHPDGLFYGGNRPSWSNRTLHAIVDRYLSASRNVIIVDFHTGLGPYGYGEIIVSEPEDAPDYQRAVAVWGTDRVKSTVSGESVSSHLSGTIKLAFSRMLPDTQVTAIGLEFGTLSPTKVFLAMREENWLHHHGGTHCRDADRIKQRLLNAFYPADDMWRLNIWEQGRMVVQQALAAL